MDLLKNNSSHGLDKPTMEQVQQEKQEYYLLGSFIRTRGLLLFGYNYIKDEIFPVDIKYSDTIHLVPSDGKLLPIDYESEKCTIDSRFTYFESLNHKNAISRVNKYKQGKIHSLSNLRKYNPDGIKFF